MADADDDDANVEKEDSGHNLYQNIWASILPPWCVLYSASGSGHSFCKLLMFKGIKDDVRIIRYDGAELYPD